MHPAPDQRSMPHVVELPQIVRRGMLEPDERARRRGRRGDAGVAVQDRGDRARCRWGCHTVAAQPVVQRAPAPARGVALGDDAILQRRIGAGRTGVRAAGAVRQRIETALAIAADPLVGGGRGELVPPAQRPDVGAGLGGQLHELTTIVHGGFHLGRHDRPPCGWSDHAAQMCSPCLRTGVHHVPGPYTTGPWRRCDLPASRGGSTDHEHRTDPAVRRVREILRLRPCGPPLRMTRCNGGTCPLLAAAGPRDAAPPLLCASHHDSPRILGHGELDGRLLLNQAIDSVSGPLQPRRSPP
jgi:hypothetical protein